MVALGRLSLDDPAWRRFVERRPEATPFHDPAWAGLLSECYDLPGYVLARRDAAGEVAAGLPLLEPPRLPGRPRRLVSLPFTDAVAPLADGAPAAGLAAALDGARRELGAGRIELRCALDGARPEPVTAVTHALELNGDPDLLARGLSKMRRRNVRLAESKGLTVTRAESEREVAEVFYALHLATRRRLGVPAQPRRYFRLLWRRVLEPGGGLALLVRQGRAAIAGAVFLVGNGTTIYKYGASDAAALAARPNDLLLWTAIREACTGGCTRFDFGRSELEANGLREFKRSFGAAETPLVYSTIGVDTGGRLTGTGGVGAAVIRRAPAWMTRVAGELLYRYAA